MYKMSETDIKQEIEKINEYVSKCMWLDFEMTQMSFIKVVLSGQIDQTTNDYAIEIEFSEPYCISSLFLWSVDTAKPLIELATEKEFIEINQQYRVEQGNYIFKINSEDYDQSPIFIAAKKIQHKILNEKPF